jgi:hypothetical protein
MVDFVDCIHFEDVFLSDGLNLHVDEIFLHFLSGPNMNIVRERRRDLKRG